MLKFCRFFKKKFFFNYKNSKNFSLFQKKKFFNYKIVKILPFFQKKNFFFLIIKSYKILIFTYSHFY
ncbi:MAG: hypothetical protein B6I24_06950 [Bacteroidetes bacterium 4572_128]|nr:MAG: hypothetical protein B6I24_06950 [Bacteroidetes bacterium 4572_128]